jgi:hypothetical protein
MLHKDINCDPEDLLKDAENCVMRMMATANSTGCHTKEKQLLFAQVALEFFNNAMLIKKLEDIAEQLESLSHSIRNK